VLFRSHDALHAALAQGQMAGIPADQHRLLRRRETFPADGGEPGMAGVTFPPPFPAAGEQGTEPHIQDPAVFRPAGGTDRDDMIGLVQRHVAAAREWTPGTHSPPIALTTSRSPGRPIQHGVPCCTARYSASNLCA